MRSSCMLLVSSLSIAIALLLVPAGDCARIIGGHEVAPHSRPYMVLLELDNVSICGGALIAENWVLTAAHCEVTETSKAILGAHLSSKDEPGKQKISIKKKFSYPSYNKKTHEGDLQLLQLSQKAKISNKVSTLPLPNKGDDVKPGTRCRIAGWGIYGNEPSKSPVLREVNISIIDRIVCNDKKHYNRKPNITSKMICAGDLHGGKDSCNGDSGSPLLCDGIFRGITAFGLLGKCGSPEGPGVYTLLTNEYLKWIKGTMKKGWRDGSAVKALAYNAQQPGFKSPVPL